MSQRKETFVKRSNSFKPEEVSKGFKEELLFYFYFYFGLSLII